MNIEEAKKVLSDARSQLEAELNLALNAVLQNHKNKYGQLPEGLHIYCNPVTQLGIIGPLTYYFEVEVRL